jgi:hypothetical protein
MDPGIIAPLIPVLALATGFLAVLKMPGPHAACKRC